jgi:hypothetical protein
MFVAGSDKTQLLLHATCVCAGVPRVAVNHFMAELHHLEVLKHAGIVLLGPYHWMTGEPGARACEKPQEHEVLLLFTGVCAGLLQPAGISHYDIVTSDLVAHRDRPCLTHIVWLYIPC